MVISISNHWIGIDVGAHVSFTCVPNSAIMLYEVIYIASKIVHIYCVVNLSYNKKLQVPI